MILVPKERRIDFRLHVILLDGSYIVIRSICSGDKRALRDFHTRQSLETRFFRYHYSKGTLTESDLHDFCDIDYTDSIALVAERSKTGKTEIVGVGRFFRLPTKLNTAEIAFVVQDNEQRKGIGTQLLKYLALLAWECDIYYFVGEVLKENGRMLSIFRNSDPEMYLTDEDDHTCQIALSVQQIIDRAF